MEIDRFELIKKVSRKLLIALVVLVITLFLLLFIPLILQGYASLAPVVMIAGMIGAFVSVQKRLKKYSDNDLRLFAESNLYPWLSPLVGGLLAIVLYLLFLSGLLTGSLFPEFIPDPKTPEAVVGITKLFHMMSNDPRAYAKLLFWSFVAGYSEEFVIGIIGNFEKKSEKA